MKNITIRPLSADDMTSAKDVIDTLGLFPGEMLDEMAAPFLTSETPDDLWFVALDTQVVLGLVYCSPERMTDGTWNLLLIAVRESEQGQGVGSRLTRHLEQTLSQRNARVLIVETSGLPDFDRTRAVYRTLDYVEVARIPEFYTAGEDKVVFWKLLPDHPGNRCVSRSNGRDVSDAAGGAVPDGVILSSLAAGIRRAGAPLVFRPANRR